MCCYFFGGLVQAVCLNLGHPQNSNRENTSISDTHPNQEWFKIIGIPDWNAWLILNIANGVRPLVPHVDPSDRDAFPAQCWNQFSSRLDSKLPINILLTNDSMYLDIDPIVPFF